MINILIKKLFDLFVIFLTFPILIIFFLIIVVLVYFSIGRPIFFVQIRSGLNYKPFKLIKFRTMKDNNLDDNLRITKLGNFLRIHSLDEIPEILNVLKGEMSLVGPRPLYREYDKLYSNEQSMRMKTKPGITGWAQINGRNSISWKEKFILDNWYVKNENILLDIKILIKTFFKMFKDKNIYDQNNKVVKKFNGHN